MPTTGMMNFSFGSKSRGGELSAQAEAEKYAKKAIEALKRKDADKGAALLHQALACLGR